jgi:hypothetical protein
MPEWERKKTPETRKIEALFRVDFPRTDAYLDCNRFNDPSTDQLVSGGGRRGGNMPVALCHL